MMRKGVNSAGKACKNDLNRVLLSAFSPTGTWSFFALMIRSVKIRIVNRIPGTYPPRKREPMEILVSPPYTINGKLGGITAPRLLLEDSIAAAIPFGYPFFFINGMVIAPVAATLATADPERLAKITLEKRAIIPSPPRLCPTRVLIKSTSLLEIPPESMIAPTRIKNGIAVKEKEFTPPYICCAMVENGTFGRNKSKYANAERPSEKAIGIPIARKIKNDNIKIATCI